MSKFPAHIRLIKVETLSEDWNVLRRYSLEHRSPDGSVSIHHREVVHKPDTANVLAYSRTRGTVLLLSQIRAAVALVGNAERFLEVPGGIVDSGESPAAAAIREVREETGIVLDCVRLVGCFYLSPTLSTERSYLFLADLDCVTQKSSAISCTDTLGEIELTEIPVTEAVAMCWTGAITDAKTALLIFALANTGACRKGDTLHD